jgi:hypothetical protein
MRLPSLRGAGSERKSLENSSKERCENLLCPRVKEEPLLLCSSIRSEFAAKMARRLENSEPARVSPCFWMWSKTAWWWVSQRWGGVVV